MAALGLGFPLTFPQALQNTDIIVAIIGKTDKRSLFHSPIKEIFTSAGNTPIGAD